MSANAFSKKTIVTTVGWAFMWLVGLLTSAAAQTTRVSVTSGGVQATGGSSRSSAISADGRYVAFESASADLVPGDTGGETDVFVRDRVTGFTTRISLGVGGVETDSDSSAPAISGDGRFVAFHSAATNLVPGDTNNRADAFVHDRATGENTRVNLGPGGVQGNGHSALAALSFDGRYVTFVSSASNLVSDDTNSRDDIFVHDRTTGATTRVSLATGGAQANGECFAPEISSDGRYVAFHSLASNLVANDTNGFSDVFLHDRTTGVTTRVSVGAGGVQSANGNSLFPAISADGRYVAFASEAPNLVANDTNGLGDVFVHDRTTGATTRVSVATGGVQSNGYSVSAALGADGRYVAFTSLATNLVPGDSNGDPDVFLHDRASGTTRRISVANGGTQAVNGIDNNGNRQGSGFPVMSADGRYVAFASWSVNLVDRDTNARQDVFLHDTRMYQRQRVSVSTAGTQGTDQSGAYSEQIAVSRDGGSIAFDSNAPNLVAGDTNNVVDIFVRDRATGITTRVNVATGGTQAAGGHSVTPVLSGDGRYVAFSSFASNLVPGDSNGASDVFVHDRATGETTRVSVASNGAQGNGSSHYPSLSEDGRYVAFSSDASTLVAGDTNAVRDVFVHDRATGTTSRVSVASGGTQALGASYAEALSGDGRFVAFTSEATNLVPGDDNGRSDVFVHDRQTGATTRVNVRTGGVQSSLGDSFHASLSADGRYVAFASDAYNLVVGDTNNLTDVFVHDRLTGQTTRVSVTSGGLQAGGISLGPTMSGDGRYVAFFSDAPNLVGGDTNNLADVFVHDRTTGETVRASLTAGEEQANGVSYSPVLSGDGRTLVFISSASNVVAGDSNAQDDVFVRALSPVVSVVSPRSGPTTGATTLRIDGAGFAPGTTVSVGALAAQNVDASDPERLWAATPPNVAGRHDLVVKVPGFDEERLPLGFTYVALSGSATADADGDGLPDAYEAQFSFDLLDPADAATDPDADGPSVAAERAAGTHPNGRVTRYLAEGATSAFFTTELALANPGDGDATVLARFLPSTGMPITHVLRVPARSRRTIDVGELPGLASAEFSTLVESDRLLAVDRTMRWDAATGYGSHTETAAPSLSTTWYLAEGATHNGFDLFYLLQNPESTPTAVQITFLRPAPASPIVKTYTVPAQSRYTVWVDSVDTALANTDVSAEIRASKPIMVERAMYLTRPGQVFAAGHESAGVMFPTTSWFLAEGATGPYFDLFVLLANPGTTAAEVRAAYLKPDGTTVVKTYTVAPQSRFNIWVDYEDPRLADTAVSTTVDVTNGVPIVVERSMWWPGTGATWQEAHNSPGATSTGTAWAVASAEDGGASSAETYVLVANTAAFAATVRVKVLLEDGRTLTQQFPVQARSRFNVAMRTAFPDAAGQRFGVVVESVGVGAAPIVVESAVYGNARGVVWSAGSNALATKLR